jgi:hypothetical protein
MEYTDLQNCIQKKGVVIFLDALGVKHLDTEGSCEFIRKRSDFLKEVHNKRDLRAKEFKQELDVDLPDLDIALFQDSIIISWEEPEPKQKLKKYHFSFFQAAGQLLIDAITEAIKQDLYFRCAISQGEYVVNVSNKNVTIIGPAVSDAAHYCEMADWIGAILTPNCEKNYLSYLTYISEIETKREGRLIHVEDVISHYRFLFVKYSVPLSISKTNVFSTKPNSLALRREVFVSSWPVIACMIEPEISISKILYEKSITEKPEYQSKYFNSYRFLEWYKSQFWEGLKKQPGE